MDNHYKDGMELALEVLKLRALLNEATTKIASLEEENKTLLDCVYTEVETRVKLTEKVNDLTVENSQLVSIINEYLKSCPNNLDLNKNVEIGIIIV